ncbi:MAG: hypothetical protein FWC95_04795 [Defluviitaleaceae bacterium]|nr:hypothetical protein [Defluviitaleaceae bacterium]
MKTIVISVIVGVILIVAGGLINRFNVSDESEYVPEAVATFANQGVWHGRVYHNEWLGFRFFLGGETWVDLSDIYRGLYDFAATPVDMFIQAECNMTEASITIISMDLEVDDPLDTQEALVAAYEIFSAILENLMHSGVFDIMPIAPLYVGNYEWFGISYSVDGINYIQLFNVKDAHLRSIDIEYALAMQTVQTFIAMFAGIE